ncbi:type II toxin-antitoxin system HigA family antitoxin [Deinococcus sp. AJ005]|uniref:helix-turn-helix domain-containing protein n=1 Tax=Deinococcus sp. AJ005 TaxID=2652443 RepID=UPI001865713B|nr:helix-turn-helix domain-containing protein [Deinococcus sp. AJ005]
MTTLPNFNAFVQSWQQIHSYAPGLFVEITDDETLKQATDALKALDAEMSASGIHPHPLDDLANTVMNRIVAYEAVHYPIPDIDAPDILKVFMEERHLTQQQLAKAVGISQSTISQLLGRRRAFTLEHLHKLAGYFGVKVSLFLPD